jgi:hypothetical protein
MKSTCIYELRGESDKYPGFLQVFVRQLPKSDSWKEDVGIQSLTLGSKPFGDEYLPVPLVFDNDGRRKNVAGDLSCRLQPFLVFSNKAKQALELFLSPKGEFLEVAAPVPGFIGYRVLNQIDGCIDMELSTYTKYDNGKVLVRKPTMYESKVRGLDIFSIPEMPSSIFVSQAFKDAVVKAKLKGFDLSKEIPLV